MIIWNEETVNNNMRCTGCGINFLNQNKWPVNVMIYPAKGYGVCKHCGKEVCKIKDHFKPSSKMRWYSSV